MLPLLFALVSIAEFLHVEQSVTGLDCMSCAESAPRNLKKIKGVESASFRTKDSVAVLELKPGNTVTLGEIRDAVSAEFGPLPLTTVAEYLQACEEAKIVAFR